VPTSTPRWHGMRNADGSVYREDESYIVALTTSYCDEPPPEEPIASRQHSR
jgi:hypothetical protein